VKLQESFLIWLFVREEYQQDWNKNIQDARADNHHSQEKERRPFPWCESLGRQHFDDAERPVKKKALRVDCAEDALY